MLYALNGLSYLAVSLLSAFIYNNLSKKDDSRHLGNIIGTIGIFYFLMGFLDLMWMSGFIVPNEKDFLLLNTVITVLVSVLLTYAAFKITSSRNLIYILLLYFTSLFAINYSFRALLITTVSISYLLTLLVFLDLAFLTKGRLRQAGDLGIVYVTASILASSMYFLGNPHKSFWFVPNIILIFVLTNMFKSIRDFPEKPKKELKESTLEYIKTLARFLVFVVSLTAFVLISTISIHELGHAFVAQYYGCSQFKAVIYDVISPHTELTCDSVYYNDLALTLSGLLATFMVGIIFLITGISLTVGISYLIFGFGMMFSYGDLTEIGLSSNILAPLIVLSVIVIILSIVKVSTYYLRQQELFKKV